jgi:ferrous iron transport protein A
MSEHEGAYPLSGQVQPLAAFTAGQGALITAFLGGRKMQERLIAMGLFPGQRLMVCQNNGSSLVVKLNGNSLALGKGISQKILATPTPNRCQRAEDCECPVRGTKEQR